MSGFLLFKIPKVDDSDCILIEDDDIRIDWKKIF
jgi:hypothetical protein